MRLNRKEFLGLVGRGAAASVAAASVSSGAQAQERDTQTAGAPKAKKEVRGNAIKGTTDAVKQFITRANLRDMPPNVVAEGKRCMVDGFGVLLAGSAEQGSQILRHYAQKSSGAKEAIAKIMAARIELARPMETTTTLSTRWRSVTRSTSPAFMKAFRLQREASNFRERCRTASASSGVRSWMSGRLVTTPSSISLLTCWCMRSATISACPMTTCMRWKRLCSEAPADVRPGDLPARRSAFIRGLGFAARPG